MSVIIRRVALGLLALAACLPARAAAQDAPTFGDQLTYAWAAGSQYQPFAGDFDGDGNMDIGLRHSIDGTFFIKHGPSFADQFSYSWAAGSQYQPFVGDFNGDGKTDIGLRHSIDGTLFWKSGPTFSDQSSLPWAAGDQYQPVTADFDGDGKADLGLRYVPDGTFFIRLAPGFSAQRTFQWAAGPQYQPFAADFDGDGKADLGLRHSIDGTFFMRPGPDFAGQSSYRWSAGDQYQAFVGDVNRDGKADIGLRFIPDGTFAILAQQPKVTPPSPAVTPTVIPTIHDDVAGDRDGDGVNPPLDCDDANASIRPGTRDVPGDRIDQDCSGADAPYPQLKARAGFSWRFIGARTVLTKVLLTDLAGGETAHITCRGKRCAFKSRTYANVTAGKRALTSLFGSKRQLRAGDRVEIRISATRAIGSSTMLVIRKRKQDPRISRSCVTPGGAAATPCP